ncbi:MAG: hypothetical protein ACOYT8_03155 [Candidatus Dependentiae bacterium]
MEIKKIIFLSLFVLMWAIIAGITFEHGANAKTKNYRSYRNDRGKAVGKGILFGGLGGAAIGGIAGGRNGALIGLGTGAGLGAIAGAASTSNKRKHSDED